MPPIIHSDRCKACHACVEACQADVFFGSEPRRPPVVAYPDECWHCNACVMSCPAGAVTLRLPLNCAIMYDASPRGRGRNALPKE